MTAFAAWPGPAQCEGIPRFAVVTLLAILALLGLVLAAVGGFVVGSRLSRPPGPDPATARTAVPVPALPASAPPAGGYSGATDAAISVEKARIIRSLDAETARLRQTLTDAAAALGVLDQFRRDRERLFGDAADARAETARYRQLIVDIENNAPPPILSGATGPDDLKLIVGIGPVLERMLHTLGIATFRQIARWSERDVAEFDAKLPEFPGRIQRDQWVTQARALHQSKYGETLPDSRGRA